MPRITPRASAGYPGKLQGITVTCRAHGFRYDVTSGKCINIEGLRVTAYPVKIVDGKIMVAVG